MTQQLRHCGVYPPRPCAAEREGVAAVLRSSSRGGERNPQFCPGGQGGPGLLGRTAHPRHGALLGERGGRHKEAGGTGRHPAGAAVHHYRTPFFCPAGGKVKEPEGELQGQSARAANIPCPHRPSFPTSPPIVAGNTHCVLALSWHVSRVAVRKHQVSHQG